MRYILIILAIMILVGGFFIYYGIYYPREPSFPKIVAFSIKKGEGAKEISLHLKEQNLIRYSSLFRIYALIRRETKSLKAGEYELSRAMNIPEIVKKLVLGEVIKKKITIIEGWTVSDIQELLRDRPGTVPLELEGYLFPDTYEISPEDGIEEIVKKMRDNFDKKLAPYRNEVSGSGLTLSQVVTMASLLEKEVKTLEDKKIVSGILWKRLAEGIPLQVDATITYLTGKKTTRIAKEETEIDSPYNTYRYQGLPLGPIANPGLESLIAAIYPEESQYWYYLSSPEGKTIFSKTLEEHNIAKAKYLK